MPTRKQKRREAKTKRHEYEWAYVDDEGNDVEPPPEDSQPKAKASAGSAKKQQQSPSTRTPRRQPQPPSWQRAGRRAVILGAVVFALFGVMSKSHNYLGALVAALIYTVLFIPFTYVLDRFAYNRWQARDKAPPRKS